MRSSRSIWVDLKFNDKCPPRDTRGMDRGGGGNVTTEIKIRVMQPRAQKCPELPEARSGKEQNLPESLKMKLALPPGFWASGFQSYERINLYYFIPCCLYQFLTEATGNCYTIHPLSVIDCTFLEQELYCVSLCGLYSFNLV